MNQDATNGPKFVVLNPGGRDPSQSFAQGPGLPDAGQHAPVNYHGYAACRRGMFLRDVSKVPHGADVLLLLRRDLRHALKALPELRRRRATVFIAWKEAGLHQVSSALSAKNAWEQFTELCGQTDGSLCATPELPALHMAAGARLATYLPTPYPVELAEWNFARRPEERAGIFIGTREFGITSRNHLLALRIAEAIAPKHAVPLTMMDDGSAPGWLRKSLQQNGVRLIRGPLPYAEYLRLLAGHRVIFQLDRSAVPGQVAGDCCLARVLCIGGDGAVEREIFPETCGHGRTATELSELLERALTSPSWAREQEENAQRLARQRISFATIAEKLQKMFAEAATEARF